MYRQENATRKIIFISLLNSEQRHLQSYFVITVQTTVALTMCFIVYTHVQSFLNLCIIKKKVIQLRFAKCLLSISKAFFMEN